MVGIAAHEIWSITYSTSIYFKILPKRYDEYEAPEFNISIK